MIRNLEQHLAKRESRFRSNGNERASVTFFANLGPGQRGARSCGDTSELLSGFYATVESPNEIFQCFGYAYTRPSSRCPGGPAGTCAPGRDPGSLTCSACLPGYMPRGAECVQCAAGAEPFFWLALLGSMMVLSVGILLH